MKEHSYKDNVGHYFAVVPERELQDIMTGKVHYLTRLPIELELNRGDVIFLGSDFTPTVVRCAIEVSEVLDMSPMTAWRRFKMALPLNFIDNWSICSEVTLIRINDVRVFNEAIMCTAFGIESSSFHEARGRLVRINKSIGYKGNSFYFIGRF